jgi:hypothetical protein
MHSQGLKGLTALLRRPQNTEFRGEAPFQPCLLRCNSSFGGAFMLRRGGSTQLRSRDNAAARPIPFSLAPAAVGTVTWICVPASHGSRVSSAISTFLRLSQRIRNPPFNAVELGAIARAAG